MKIKICGIKEPRHAITACEAGADFIGMVFYEKSPRYVTLSQAAKVAEIAKSHGVASVALTVNASDEVLKSITADVRPDYVQLHGAEDAAYIKRIRPLLGAGKIIRTLQIGGSEDTAAIDKARASADLLLLDAKPQADDKLPGGNARAFDWSWLADSDLHNCLLAGGLNADNLSAAIAACNPWGIDVSSGVEKSYGVKCSRKIRQFITTARQIRQ